MIAIINFKAYEQGTGKNAVKLAKTCASVAASFPGVRVFLAVQAVDLSAVRQAVSLPILAQHVDGEGPGGCTGATIVESVKAAGAVGSLINHSEQPVSAAHIDAAIARLRLNGMLSVLCVKNLAEAKRFDKCSADFLAIEPSELIGGTVSVVLAKPELIERAAGACKTPLLVGAGIHERADVVRSLELGAQGILVASDVVKAKNPRKELMDLLSGFERAKNLSKSPK